jgi:hypothetical protein
MSRALCLAVLCAASCGPREKSGPEDDPPLELMLDPLGFLSQEAYPNDQVELRVIALRTAGGEIASADHVVPANGEVVSWSVTGTGATLSQPSTLTGADGITSVSVGVGSIANTQFQVTPVLNGVAPDFVFTIRVRSEQRDLELLTGPAIDSVIDRSERLRVRLVRTSSDPNAPPSPVAGAILPVQLAGGARNGARLELGDGASGTITTDLSGVAQLRFSTGGAAGVSYDVDLCSDGTCPARTIRINVAARDNGAECQYFTDCLAGYVCEGGACVPQETYCATDRDCPTGYVCGADRTCEIGGGGGDCVVDDDCTNGWECGGSGACIPPGGCESDLDCPEGWTCDLDSGACIGPSGTGALDVRGDWLTRWHFDISDTLPGFFQALEPIVAFLDLVFRSQLQIDVPILGDILEALLDQLIAEYVPPWVRTVVTVLADFIHVFDNVDVDGEMFLDQFPVGPPLGTTVRGDEDWVSALFYIASLCPGGVQQFNEDPTCGQIDVVLAPTVSVSYSNNDPTVGVRVEPFNGEVRGPELWLYGRDVEIELRQLVNVLLDVIIAAASRGDYYDFEEFLVDVVPCEDLQYAIDDLACDITDGDVCSIPGIEAACTAAAAAAVAALTDALGGIGVGLEIDFDARAVIHDSPVGGRADILGSPGTPDNDAESAMIGDTEAIWVFGGELDPDSWWFAIR